MPQFTHGKFPMDEMMMIIDGDGQTWQHVTHIDTRKGQILFIRTDGNGNPIEMPHPPQGLPGIPVQVSMVEVPTPITIVFYGDREHQLHMNNELPSCLVLDMFMAYREGTQFIDAHGDVGVFVGPPEEEFEHNEPLPKDRFQCPCCSGSMKERYSTKKQWYLICTECGAQLIK